MSLQSVVREHGPWTAMAIKLGDGSYTREPAPDHRLRRILQIASDLVGKPLAKCRVLDLACLEGHYAIEFGMHGAEAVGIEGRAASVAKCDFAKNSLGLDKVRFVQDDVRNLSSEKYGVFDIVVCSGLIYHLPAPDALRLLRAMHECCAGIVIIDTFISLFGKATIEVDGAVRRGHVYGEHDPDETLQERARKLWASLDNETSFWFTEASLMNMLLAIGFTSLFDVVAPTMPGMPRDRKTYVAVKGRQAVVRSSDLTQAAMQAEVAETPSTAMDASQIPRGPVFLLLKRTLPQPVKEVVKAVLRALRLMPPDSTPDFMRKPPT